MQPPVPDIGRCPAVGDPSHDGRDAAQLDQYAADVEEHDFDAGVAHTTTFTSLLPGGTITLRPGLPSIHFWVVASASAAALISSLLALALASTFERNLPFTCTTISMRSWSSASGSGCGHGWSISASLWPSRRQSS